MDCETQEPGSVTAEHLCKQLTEEHLEPLLRGLLAIAEANGGMGLHYKNAHSACTMILESLTAMRKGEQ